MFTLEEVGAIVCLILLVYFSLIVLVGKIKFNINKRNEMIQLRKQQDKDKWNKMFKMLERQ